MDDQLELVCHAKPILAFIVAFSGAFFFLRLS